MSMSLSNACKNTEHFGRNAECAAQMGSGIGSTFTGNPGFRKRVNLLAWLAAASILRSGNRRKKRLRYAGQLEQLNRDLAFANRELKDFTYVASHDLQEPLRKVSQFGHLLQVNAGAAWLVKIKRILTAWWMLRNACKR